MHLTARTLDALSELLELILSASQSLILASSVLCAAIVYGSLGCQCFSAAALFSGERRDLSVAFHLADDIFRWHCSDFES